MKYVRLTCYILEYKNAKNVLHDIKTLIYNTIAMRLNYFAFNRLYRAVVSSG